MTEEKSGVSVLSSPSNPPEAEAGGMGLRFDYIIAGTGAAGFSLAMHLLQQPQLQQKKILLVDSDSKTKNDRTWCFWEKGSGLFEPIVAHRWQHLHFYAPQFSKLLHIQPYTYKLIYGLHFYNYCRKQLQQYSNVQFLQSSITAITNTAEGACVHDDAGKVYTAQYVFNSIPPAAPPQLKPNDIWMLQHFKGWVVKTESPVFNPAEAVMMDFRTEQKDGATFFYVLPFSEKEALIEYTLFSEKLLSAADYDAALKSYLSQHYPGVGYKIADEEFGVIPMTTYRFSRGEKNIINIGTAGGFTKGSSGYTFQNIQKSSAAIAATIAAGRHPLSTKHASSRFPFYDRVLLQVLKNGELEGRDIFARMYQKNSAAKVLQFLDNDTSLSDELKIISRLPTVPFSKAALRQL